MKPPKLFMTLLAFAGIMLASCSKDADPIAVSGVTLNKSTLTLGVGENETLIATVLPDNATDKTVTWTSSVPSVSTVDDTGKVTALTAGTATITATSGGKSATCAVTVNPNVYIAGIYSDGSKNVACQWVNGQPTNLAVPAGAGDARGTSIAVSDGRIYVAGYYFEGGKYVACQWDDGQRTNLAAPAGAGSARGYSIAVSGDKIYVAGQYYDGSKNVACQWVDGQLTNLPVPAGGGNAVGYSIVVI